MAWNNKGGTVKLGVIQKQRRVKREIGKGHGKLRRGHHDYTAQILKKKGN